MKITDRQMVIDYLTSAALVDYVKAHHALVPVDFDHKYSNMSDYLKQNMEDY